MLQKAEVDKDKQRNHQCKLMIKHADALQFEHQGSKCSYHFNKSLDRSTRYPDLMLTGTRISPTCHIALRAHL
jgi:hypothetical protein